MLPGYSGLCLCVAGFSLLGVRVRRKPCSDYPYIRNSTDSDASWVEYSFAFGSLLLLTKVNSFTTTTRGVLAGSGAVVVVKNTLQDFRQPFLHQAKRAASKKVHEKRLISLSRRWLRGWFYANSGWGQVYPFNYKNKKQEPKSPANR